MVAAALVSVSKEGTRYSVMLSLAPDRVLAGRLPGVGELCTAGVESKEDHGYIMDIGSNTVRGFVPSKLSHPERKCLPGDKLQAKVLRLNPANRQLHLTTKPILDKEQFTIVKDYDSAVPGTITEKLFWLGQAVKCRVLDSDKARDRVSLNLVLDTMVPMGRRERGRQIFNYCCLST